MTQANYNFLENHREVYDEVVNAQTAFKANRVKDDLLRIMQEEFMPGYIVMDSCVSCLFDLVRLLYQRFDKWKAIHDKPVPLVENIVEANDHYKSMHDLYEDAIGTAGIEIMEEPKKVKVHPRKKKK